MESNTIYLQITNFRAANGDVLFQGCTALYDHDGVLKPIFHSPIDLYLGFYDAGDGNDLVVLESEDDVAISEIKDETAISVFRRCSAELKELILKNINA